MGSLTAAEQRPLGGRAALLVDAIQQLSLSRDLERVAEIVRTAARALSGADGATFVLRDHDMCFYADEDAIGPLWKGRRFPINACISGWAMQNRQTVVIEDIYVDDRIPIDAYRPTFVKSLAMVPIRTAAPIGAIGHYWARPHVPTPEDLAYLQALADSTSIAIENVQLYLDLERRVHERTAALEAANSELEAFSYSVSHDLRAPLRAIHSFTKAVIEDCGASLPLQARNDLSRVVAAGERMSGLIDDLLRLAQVGHGEVQRQQVDVSRLARMVADEIRGLHPQYAGVRVDVEDQLVASADPRLTRVLLENLLGNAIKFSHKVREPRVVVGRAAHAPVYVQDNGAGFDLDQASRLFKPFSRLHSDSEFPGTGIGLATVQRIIQRHRGQIRAEGRRNEGATFYFNLEPEADAS